MQKYLDKLLEKYSVSGNAVLTDNKTVTIDGKKLPLLPWRNERRFVEMRKLVTDGEINGISVMRTLRIVRKGMDLYDELYRELDLCRYILNTDINEIFVIGDEKYALNIIAATKDGFVCTLEISATLSDDETIIDKHEIIAGSGVACDRAADTQVPQNSIYVFGGKDNAEVYTDVDAELFGLNVDECAVVRSAFEIAKTGCDLSDDVNKLYKLIDCAKQSLKNCENIVVGG